VLNFNAVTTTFGALFHVGSALTITLCTDNMPSETQIFRVTRVELLQRHGQLMNHITSTRFLLLSEPSAEEHREDIHWIVHSATASSFFDSENEML
jgi:hypothetical protein